MEIYAEVVFYSCSNQVPDPEGALPAITLSPTMVPAPLTQTQVLVLNAEEYVKNHDFFFLFVV